jgi:hypothetical protein
LVEAFDDAVPHDGHRDSPYAEGDQILIGRVILVDISDDERATFA